MSLMFCFISFVVVWLESSVGCMTKLVILGERAILHILEGLTVSFCS